MIIARRTSLAAFCLGMTAIGATPMLKGVSIAEQNDRIQPDSPLIQKRTGELLFDPSHPTPVSYQDNDLSLRLDSNEPRLAVIIQSKGVTVRRIALPEEMAQVNEIRRATASRAVVLGMVSGDVSEVAVLDTQSVNVSDVFLAYEPTPSPNGHYLAFIKFYPAHFIEGPDDRYMLYDLSLGASQNRPPGINLTDKADVGVTVYPPGKGNREGDNTGVPDGDAHSNALDTFFWSPNSDRYLFADKYLKTLKVITVRVGSTRPAVSVVNISQDELCAERNEKSCDVHLAGVDFETKLVKGVTVHFRGVAVDGSLRKDFHFGDQQFSPIN